jgi:hypothetical protein
MVFGTRSPGSRSASPRSKLVSAVSPTSKSDQQKMEDASDSKPDEASPTNVDPAQTSSKSSWSTWWGGGSGSGGPKVETGPTEKCSESNISNEHEADPSLDEPESNVDGFQNEVEPWPEVCAKIDLVEQLTEEELEALSVFQKAWHDVEEKFGGFQGSILGFSA